MASPTSQDLRASSDDHLLNTLLLAEEAKRVSVFERVAERRITASATTAVCMPHLRANERNTAPLPAARLPAPDVCELVSVLAPTTSERHWAHPNLYRCFDQQRWPSKELVVLDTGAEPSAFFLSLTDVRVRYHHLPLGSSMLELAGELNRFVAAAAASDGSERWREVWAHASRAVRSMTVDKEWFELEDEGSDSADYLRMLGMVVTLGAKRNWLVSQARGNIVANFDDDDIYAADYLSRMVLTLRSQGADLVKLSSFMHFQGGMVCLCDPGVAAPHVLNSELSDVLKSELPEDNGSHGCRWGYGFSCVHTKELVLQCPYEHVNFGEDYRLVLAAAEAGCRCLAFDTAVGDAPALHVSHFANSSTVNFGRRLLGLADLRSTADTDDPSEDLAARFARRFDALFSQPCSELLDALVRDCMKAMPPVTSAASKGPTSALVADWHRGARMRAHLGIEASVAGAIGVDERSRIADPRAWERSMSRAMHASLHVGSVGRTVDVSLADLTGIDDNRA